MIPVEKDRIVVSGWGVSRGAVDQAFGRIITVGVAQILRPWTMIQHYGSAETWGPFNIRRNFSFQTSVEPY